MWLLCADGRFRATFRSAAKARRVADWMNGRDPSAEVWGKVAAGLAADLGTGTGGEGVGT